jgi:hypothetical protein
LQCAETKRINRNLPRIPSRGNAPRQDEATPQKT